MRFSQNNIMESMNDGLSQNAVSQNNQNTMGFDFGAWSGIL
jgi:hypothetical protein